MKAFVLERYKNSVYGVFGRWMFVNKELCVTLEPRDNFNKKDISCIPVGRYRCTVEFHEDKGYRLVRLHDVPGRSGILVHIGNTLRDTSGCILVGHYANDKSVVKSRYAMGDLMLQLPDEFDLYVRNSLTYI